MPVDETTRLKITCDNPSCPGNDLKTTSRDGWIFLSGEVYGETQSGQFAYCSSGCVSAHAANGVTSLPAIGPEVTPV